MNAERRRTGERLLLAILCLIAFLFFSNDFSLVDIQKTAIVLAVGIDRADEDITVTTVVAKPQTSDSSSSASEVAVSGTGSTVAEAVQNVNRRIGQLPKFPFCDLIVLGESALSEDVFSTLGFFLRNEYMSDNCLVATCEGDAAALLAAKLPMEDMTTEGVKNVLSVEANHAGIVTSVNLKDFSAGYYAEERSGFLPRLRLTEEEEPSLDASRLALFAGGKQIAVLSEEESAALNLLFDPVRTATFQLDYEGQSFALGLQDVKHRVDIQTTGGVPALVLSLSAKARENDSTRDAGIEELTRSSVVDPALLAEAESLLRERIDSAFETARAGGCDLFRAASRLKRKNRKLYRAYQSTLLSRIQTKIEVKIEDLA